MAVPGGTDGGTWRYSVPEVARLLKISERAVRKRIAVGSLRAERDGPRWLVLLDGAGPAVPGGTATEPEPEPSAPDLIEVRYRVTPVEIEQAVERTGAKYAADIRAIFDQVGQLYEARLAEQAATIAAKDETIAELRRRAEVAERTASSTPNREEPPLVVADIPAVPIPAWRPWWRRWGGQER